MKKLFIFLLIISALDTHAQWTLINDAGGEPGNSSSLEINATDKGVLIPRMNFLEREAIPFPAEGLLVYQSDSVAGFYYFSGSEWLIINSKSITNTFSNTKIAYLRDLKASGANGGSFANGAWQTRDLNDLRGDSSFITISGANTFTLDSGLYEIYASAPAGGVNMHQIRLYNVTDLLVETTGLTIQSELATPPSKLNYIIRINSPKEFRIEHRCNTTNTATDAMGTAVNWGENIYTKVRIQQL